MKNVSIDLPEVNLSGILEMVEDPKGFIVFAHGAGSSRLSPRNMFVAEYLNHRGFSTLLFDLLTEQEDRVYENRFDIFLITERLIQATTWLLERKETEGLPLGYFGASTGAAAALKASINFPDRVKAVVSRGGRPDLVIPDLKNVRAATLLVVGSLDSGVIELNEEALESLRGEKNLVLIPGATHLFEEPGTLEQASDEAAEWFEKYLQKSGEELKQVLRSSR
jgi:putative phosphoribosyl transferase